MAVRVIGNHVIRVQLTALAPSLGGVIFQELHGPPQPFYDWTNKIPLWAWLLIIPAMLLINRDARRWLQNFAMKNLPEDETDEVSPEQVSRDKNLRL